MNEEKKYKKELIKEFHLISSTINEEEILEAYNESVQDLNLDPQNYSHLIENLGSPEDFIQSYQNERLRELNISTTKPAFRSTKIQKTSATIDHIFFQIRVRITKPRVKKFLFTIFSLTFVFFIFIASLPLVVDTDYNRLYTFDRHRSDIELIDGVMDDEGNMFLLLNGRDLVSINNDGDRTKIQLPFSGAIPLVFQLRPLGLGVGIIVFYERSSSIGIKEFDYNLDSNSWEEVYTQDFSNFQDCNSLSDSNLFSNLFLDYTMTSLSGITASSCTNSNYWTINLLDTPSIGEINLNQTEIEIQNNITIDLRYLSSAVSYGDKVELLFEGERQTSNFAYNEFHNETTQINEDEVNEYDSQDIATLRLNKINYTLITTNKQGLRLNVTSIPITHYENRGAKLYHETGKTFMIITNGGHGSNFLNRYQIFNIENDQLYLHGYSSISPREILDQFDNNNQIVDTTPFIENNSFSIYYVSKRSIFFGDVDNSTTKLDVPQSTAGPFSRQHPITSTRSEGKSIINIRNTTGLTNNVVYVGKDNYGNLNDQFLNIETFSVIQIAGSFSTGNPSVNSVKQPRALLFTFLSLIGVLLINKENQISEILKNKKYK